MYFIKNHADKFASIGKTVDNAYVIDVANFHTISNKTDLPHIY